MRLSLISSLALLGAAPVFAAAPDEVPRRLQGASKALRGALLELGFSRVDVRIVPGEKESLLEAVLAQGDWDRVKEDECGRQALAELSDAGFHQRLSEDPGRLRLSTELTSLAALEKVEGAGARAGRARARCAAEREARLRPGPEAPAPGAPEARLRPGPEAPAPGAPEAAPEPAPPAAAPAQAAAPVPEPPRGFRALVAGHRKSRGPAYEKRLPPMVSLVERPLSRLTAAVFAAGNVRILTPTFARTAEAAEPAPPRVEPPGPPPAGPPPEPAKRKLRGLNEGSRAERRLTRAQFLEQPTFAKAGEGQPLEPLEISPPLPPEKPVRIERHPKERSGGRLTVEQREDLIQHMLEMANRTAQRQQMHHCGPGTRAGSRGATILRR